MGSRGDAYDNAVAETFFATLKKELVHRRTWPRRLELQSAVFEYIEAFYNRQRRHSTLGMLSPASYEQQRLSPLVMVEINRSNNNNQHANQVSRKPWQVQSRLHSSHEPTKHRRGSILSVHRHRPDRRTTGQ